MPSMTSSKGMSQWLENSIMPNRKVFNPEEGEWVSLDLAALTRAGLRNWTFAILPAQGRTSSAVMQMDGKGNLLRRVSWDGHDQKSGDFVRVGSYVAKLVAVNTDGTIKNQEEVLQVVGSSKVEPVVLADKPKPHAKATKKAVSKKPKAKIIQVAKAVPVSVPSNSPPSPVAAPAAVVPAVSVGSPPPVPAQASNKPSDDSDSLLDTKAPSPSSGEGAARPGEGSLSPALPREGGGSQNTAAEDNATDSGDSAHTIWKQVIQFEP